MHNAGHLRKRLVWARANARRAWTRVVFTDSKIFVGDITPAKAKWKVWHPPNRRHKPEGARQEAR